MSKVFQPDWVSPPGNTIADILLEKQITIPVFADIMNFSIYQANNLIEGITEITYKIAEGLARCLGSTIDFWLNREQQYRNSLLYLEKKVENNWLNSLPIKDMVRFEWIPNRADRLSECLNYFGVNDIRSWQEKYSQELSLVNFRTSATFENQPAAVITWIRMGEIEAEKITCQPWNANLFSNCLENIKSLTRQKDPQVFIPKLIEICAACGVAVAIVRSPAGCSASGVTKFMTSDKALLLLSFRYLSDDQFWFTFFHEAGHLLLHNKDAVFVEKKGNDLWDPREEEANDFSANILIPKEVRNELLRIPMHKRSIIGFASELGISPGIVIGQMQFMGRIKYTQYNSYKRTYIWEQ